MGFAHSPQSFPHRYVNSVIPQKIRPLSGARAPAVFIPFSSELLHLPYIKIFGYANLTSEILSCRRPDHKYDVTGSLCENNDKFAIDRMLPEVEVGDLLFIHDTGAHGFSMGYNYNGKLKSAEVLLKEDGSFEVIRRAETPKDYFATLDGTPEYEKMFGNK